MKATVVKKVRNKLEDIEEVKEPTELLEADRATDRKQVVNQITGEVIEIPTKDNKDLLKQEMNALITDDVLETYYQMQALEQKINTWKNSTKEQIKDIFKKYNIKSFKNDYIEITYVAPTKQKRVDSKLLKEAGLYDEFCKEVDVQESLRIKIND